MNIDTSMFDLKTSKPPMNFASYRQAELDNARVPTFTQMMLQYRICLIDLQ